MMPVNKILTQPFFDGISKSANDSSIKGTSSNQVDDGLFYVRLEDYCED